MSNLPSVPTPEYGAIEQVLIGGDLAKLTPEQRTQYYMRVCQSLGLNPLTKPFDYIVLNGRLTLYARRDAADQLRKIHGVSIIRLERERIEDIYIVTAYARDRSGREDSSTGAVSIAGLKGDALANALMKAETKAKRRVTLSICGLGMLDETEVETVPGAQVVNDPLPAYLPETNQGDDDDVQISLDEAESILTSNGIRYSQLSTEILLNMIANMSAMLAGQKRNPGDYTPAELRRRIRAARMIIDSREGAKEA